MVAPDSAPPRHFSRWAVLAALAAATSLGVYVLMFVGPAAVVRRMELIALREGWPAAPQTWQFVAALAQWLLAAAGLFAGPVCLLLGQLAAFDRDRRPTLRGEVLTHFALTVGWLGTAGSLLFIVSFVLLLAFGRRE